MSMRKQNKSDRYWGSKSHKMGSRAKLDPYIQLGAGVLLQASREAKEGDQAACEWLIGDFAGTFCDWVGVDHAAIQRKAAHWMEEPAGILTIRLSL